MVNCARVSYYTVYVCAFCIRQKDYIMDLKIIVGIQIFSGVTSIYNSRIILDFGLAIGGGRFAVHGRGTNRTNCFRSIKRCEIRIICCLHLAYCVTKKSEHVTSLLFVCI